MEKLIALITVLMTLPSYILSFFPTKIDRSFTISGDGCSENSITVNGKSVQAKCTPGEDGAVVFDFGEYSCDFFNYFGIKYTSDAYIEGEITYKIKNESHSEKFFLEPSNTTACFYSFIDNILDNTKSCKLLKLEFKPINSQTANFELLGTGLFNREVPNREIYIKTSKYKLGVDLHYGGAMSYLEDTDSKVQAVKKDGRIYVDSNAAKRYKTVSINNHVNLINRYDAGRLVQQSYYGTDSGVYKDSEFIGLTWRYNPVQGGNKYNETSKIVDLVESKNSIYIKCRPLDWSQKADNITPSYMEATYTIDTNVIKVSCRFVDFSGYESVTAEQEMPAFYCIEPFNRFVSISSDGKYSYENNLGFWADTSVNSNFPSSANQAAFVGEFDDSFGIGICVPGCTVFKAGVYNRGETEKCDPSSDDPTSYIAAINTLNFTSFTPIEYSYSITTGTIDEIRNNFTALK